MYFQEKCYLCFSCQRRSDEDKESFSLEKLGSRSFDLGMFNFNFHTKGFTWPECSFDLRLSLELSFGDFINTCPHCPFGLKLSSKLYCASIHPSSTIHFQTIFNSSINSIHFNDIKPSLSRRGINSEGGASKEGGEPEGRKSAQTRAPVCERKARRSSQLFEGNLQERPPAENDNF